MFQIPTPVRCSSCNYQGHHSVDVPLAGSLVIGRDVFCPRCLATALKRVGVGIMLYNADGKPDPRYGNVEIPKPPTAKIGNVVQMANRKKYVAKAVHEIPPGAKIISQTPHADNDYSYQCGTVGCRCTAQK